MEGEWCRLYRNGITHVRAGIEAIIRVISNKDIWVGEELALDEETLEGNVSGGIEGNYTKQKQI